MRYLKYAALFGLLLFVSSGSANAQVRVAVGIGGPPYYGAAPVCSYGYYDYYPYACAPYGYYGPDWFVSGIFIGAGPWFHGYYGRGYYSRPWAYYGRGSYGRPYYGRGGYYGRGYYGRPGYGGYNRGFTGRSGSAFRGGFSGGGFRGGSGSHGGGSAAGWRIPRRWWTRWPSLSDSSQ
jgi:hypothetical protein